MRRDALRERILEAAVTLLNTPSPPEREPLSVRAVTTAAGVNVAAVTTSFGGRAALLDALLLRVLAPVNVDRDRRFAALPVDASPCDVVRAFVEPLASLGLDQSTPVIHVLAAVASDRSVGDRPLDRVLRDPGVARFTDELRNRFGFPDAAAKRGVELAVGTILALSALSSGLGISDGENRERLIRFVTAGLDALRTPSAWEDWLGTTTQAPSGTPEPRG